MPEGGMNYNVSGVRSADNKVTGTDGVAVVGVPPLPGPSGHPGGVVGHVYAGAPQAVADKAVQDLKDVASEALVDDKYAK